MCIWRQQNMKTNQESFLTIISNVGLMDDDEIMYFFPCNAVFKHRKRRPL